MPGPWARRTDTMNPEFTMPSIQNQSRVAFVDRPGATAPAGPVLGLLLILAGAPAWAACPAAGPIHVSAGSPITLDGSFVPTTGFATLTSPVTAQSLPGLPPRVRLRDISVDPDGVWFVPDTGLTLGGNFFPRGTVVHWDGTTYTAPTLGIFGVDTPLRAFERDGDVMVAVLDIALWVGPSEYVDGRDVLESLDGGVTWSYVRVGAPGTLPPRVKINGLAVIDADHWLLSFDTGVSIAGTYYRPSDLVRYQRSTQTFSLESALTSASGRWHAVKPTGLSLPASAERIFCNGFE